MNDPLLLLPPGMTLEYLCRLNHVDAKWNIIALLDRAMDTEQIAQLEWDHATHSATIYINDNFHYSGAALAKVISHELIELTMVDTWLIFKQVNTQPETEQQYRTARDKQIEQRLSTMPFWAAYDVPVARS